MGKTLLRRRGSICDQGEQLSSMLVGQEEEEEEEEEDDEEENEMDHKREEEEEGDISRSCSRNSAIGTQHAAYLSELAPINQPRPLTVTCRPVHLVDPCQADLELGFFYIN